MQDNSHSIIVSVLRKEFPEIAKSIDEMINLKMPDFVLEDFSQMQLIKETFIELFIHNDKIIWRNSTDRVLCRLSSDEYRLCKVTEIRDMLMAVLLMFYQPERILTFGDEKVKRKNGIVKEATSILDCYSTDVGRSLVNSITFYKSYPGFRDEVDRLYKEIKNKIFAN